jgi:hypothetical protein
MMDFINEYGLVILFVIAVIAEIAVVITEPKKIKEWLVWACSESESSLGSGTGALKLRVVYDLFIKQFPIASKFIPYSVFQNWTERALLVFKEWLENQPLETISDEGVEEDGLDPEEVE